MPLHHHKVHNVGSGELVAARRILVEAGVTECLGEGIEKHIEQLGVKSGWRLTGVSVCHYMPDTHETTMYKRKLVARRM